MFLFFKTNDDYILSYNNIISDIHLTAQEVSTTHIAYVIFLIIGIQSVLDKICSLCVIFVF